jgi:amino acid permease
VSLCSAVDHHSLTQRSYLIINGQLMPQVVLSFAKLAGTSAEELPHWTLDRNVWILVFMILLGACGSDAV